MLNGRKGEILLHCTVPNYTQKYGQKKTFLSCTCTGLRCGWCGGCCAGWTGAFLKCDHWNVTPEQDYQCFQNLNLRMKQNQWIPLLYVSFWARLQQSMQQPGQTNCCFPSKELRLSCSIFTKKLACGIIPGMFAFSALKAAESFVTGSLFGPDLESWVVLSKLSTTRRHVLSFASDQLDHMSNMHDYCSFPKHLIFEEPYLAGLWTSCSGIRVELIRGRRILRSFS